MTSFLSMLKDARHPRLWMLFAVLATFAILLIGGIQPVHAATCTYANATGPEFAFNNAGNWSCGRIPGSGDSVVIPAATTTRLSASVTVATTTVSGTLGLNGFNLSNTSTQVYSVQVASGGTISFVGSNAQGSLSTSGTINILSGGTITLNGGTINVGGDWSDAGTFTAATGTVAFTGTTAQSIGTEAGFYNLTISNTGATVSLGGNVTSTNALTVGTGSTLAVGSRRLAPTGTITNTGTVTISSGRIAHTASAATFTDASSITVSGYTSPDTVYVTVNDPDRNLLGATIETITIPVSMNAAGGSDSETVTLAETSASSGIFRGGIQLIAVTTPVGGNNLFEVSAAGTASVTYTDTLDSDDAVVNTTPITFGGLSNGTTAVVNNNAVVSGGGGLGSNGYIPVVSTQVVVVRSSEPTTPSTPSTPSTPASSPESTGIVDPSNVSALVSGMGIVRNENAEKAIMTQVKADVKEFKLTATDAQISAMTNFIAYGISPATKNLGQGERRAVVRDYLNTVQRTAIVWSDVERLTTGQIPLSRNLTAERSQVTTAQPIFRKIFGHDPNFQNSAENLAWNTLMYRIRFTRDLIREAGGIKAYYAIYGHNPTSPLGWSVVRVLGYVK